MTPAEQVEPTSLPDAPEARDTSALHMPSLDGLRAIAVALVIFFHVGEAWGDRLDAGLGRILVRLSDFGWVGVDLFFVLSGFLITGILLASRGKPHYFRSFYARRTLRIFPLYYLYLTLLALLYLCLPGPAREAEALARAWPWYALYLTNIKLVFFPDGDVAAVSHLWSLAIEEQFYLLWPAVVALLSRRRLLAFSCGAIVAVALWRWAWLARGARPFEVYMSSWTRVDPLLLGACIAIIRTGPRSWRFLLAQAPWLLALSVIGLGSLELARHGFGAADHDVQSMGYSLLALLFASLLVLCVSRDEHERPMRVLRSRVLQRVGALSYGLYVFHYVVTLQLCVLLKRHVASPLLGLIVSLVLVALVSHGLAELSFRLFESPLLRLKRHFPRPA